MDDKLAFSTRHILSLDRPTMHLKLLYLAILHLAYYSFPLSYAFLVTGSIPNNLTSKRTRLNSNTFGYISLSFIMFSPVRSANN